MNYTDNIETIKGIGDKTASLFSKASVFCVKDLINYYPRNYISLPMPVNIADIKGGALYATSGIICSSITMFSKNGKTILSFDVKDNTGIIKIYYFNMPYLKNRFRAGMEIFIYGYVSSEKICFSNPKLSSLDEYNKLKKNMVTVYPTVKGLSSKKIQDSVRKVLSDLPKINDYLSDEYLDKYDLINMDECIRNIHMPSNMDDVYSARKRLAFNEFFTFLLEMYRLEGDHKKNSTEYICKSDSKVDELIKALPYSLTKGQSDSLNEIRRDLHSGLQMNRLLQGDVGSGKTIVAILSAYEAILNGYQVALMAPTVVLATQHYEDAIDLENKYGISLRPVLLTGSMKVSERRAVYKKIESGEASLIIGTHALFTDKVKYKNLALTVCDEQHRFGVKQRLGLMEKGLNVHQLVMSATPIPRTLGLILYGDLDISTIMEKPAERLPLKNAVVGPEYRPKNYKFIEKEILSGRQAYIICPMVEEGDAEGLKNVEDYINEIRPYFKPDIKIDILHGKMKDSKKDEIMLAFKNHEIDILISTTVIEVGVNVPNATVMMIENAERFGLSQLHQLRGRVGRGKYQSYVIYVTESKSEHNNKRLSLLTKTNDGFEIASEDLKLRGPGDFFGYRQSGNPMFKMADILTDAEILKSAKDIFDDYKNNPYLMSSLDSFENYIYSFDRGYLCL